MREKIDRRQVVEAALDLFNRRGIRAVTMDDLAAGLGLSKKTLYKVFDSKDALVGACVATILDELVPRARAALGAAVPVQQRLLGVWQVLAELPLRASRAFFADLESEYPHHWQSMEQRRRILYEHYDRLFVEGCAGGEIHADIHPRVASLAIASAIDAVVSPVPLARGEFSAEEALATLFGIFQRGLLIEPGAPIPVPGVDAARARGAAS